eukprot:TRINITY_DN87996_c0_g1_i1.p2 TRINITY_DN87996_c0_g1~~TRINITY_DN87996_c0_g1_i1.p2  ORF type:complete len:165 (+),score=1.33 TRINITY_DN87996_c0_g1_i1:149-643(+)
MYSGARMVLSFEEKQPSKMPRRLSKASTRSQRKRSFFEIVGPQSSVGEYGSYGAFASHNFAGDPHGMRSRKNPLATMEFAGRRMPSREMYVRSPTTMLAPMPFKDQLRPSRSMQADESKSCAQRAMIKYNLSIDEAGKYQQFIRLLSTFESSIFYLGNLLLQAQ